MKKKKLTEAQKRKKKAEYMRAYRKTETGKAVAKRHNDSPKAVQARKEYFHKWYHELGGDLYIKKYNAKKYKETKKQIKK